VSKKKIIYVGGLAHSGSTFLGIELCKLFGGVSVGEAVPTLKKIIDGEIDGLPRCSCGKPVLECEMWGEIIRKIEGVDLSNAYKKMIIVAEELYPNQIIIDTSKSASAMRDVVRDDYSIYVFRLYRDFRGWVKSIESASRRKGRKKYNFVCYCYMYLVQNLWLDYEFSKINILKKIGVVYDDYVFDKVDFDKSFLRNVGSMDAEGNNEYMVHDVLGNRMKDKYMVDQKISYDNSWFNDLRSVYLLPLIFPLYYYNNYVAGKRSN